jgi:hypothetical protein
MQAAVPPAPNVPVAQSVQAVEESESASAKPAAHVIHPVDEFSDP